MVDFPAAVDLDVSVADSSLRAARDRIESELGDVSVSVDGPSGGAGGGGGGMRGLQDTASDQLQETETLVDLAEERNDLLEDLTGGGAGGGGGLPRVRRPGGGGGLGGIGGMGALALGGGGLLAIGALSSVLNNFEWPDLPDVDVPEITIPDPEWTPITVTEPEWAPIDVTAPFPIPIPLQSPETPGETGGGTTQPTGQPTGTGSPTGGFLLPIGGSDATPGAGATPRQPRPTPAPSPMAAQEQNILDMATTPEQREMLMARRETLAGDPTGTGGGATTGINPVVPTAAATQIASELGIPESAVQSLARNNQLQQRITQAGLAGQAISELPTPTAGQALTVGAGAGVAASAPKVGRALGGLRRVGSLGGAIPAIAAARGNQLGLLPGPEDFAGGGGGQQRRQTGNATVTVQNDVTLEAAATASGGGEVERIVNQELRTFAQNLNRQLTDVQVDLGGLLGG